MNQDHPPLRKLENMHILFWLIKDFCWVSDYKLIGIIMIVPTLLIAIGITWFNRKWVAECCHNLAICSWIAANSTWMCGEFFFNDTTRPLAKFFFVIGFIPLLYYYVIKRLIKNNLS